MTVNRKPRRMAREPQPQSAMAVQTEHNADEESGFDSVTLPKPVRTTKQSLLIDLLGREPGAPLAAIVEATGWLPHTARAALTGLRKKGHAIERFRSDDETRYRIATAPAGAPVDGVIPAGAGDAGGSSPDPDVSADTDLACGTTAQ
jgi:hypothetical protein